MTQYFYSPETKGFYVGGLHPRIPKDIIEVNEDDYMEMIREHHLGKDIIVDDGKLTTKEIDFSFGWNRIRNIRDRLLADSDWVFNEDSPLTDDQKTPWRVYRKELRDVTTTFDNPSEVVWPIPPTSN